MYIKQMKGYVVKDVNSTHQKELIDFFEPSTHESADYVNWIAILDIKTCLRCRTQHGKIYSSDEFLDFHPPVHDYCRCNIKKMDAVLAGGATEDGRIWYEADINYDFGLRGSCRLLYSNDGLIFATYNHYRTFVHVE